MNAFRFAADLKKLALRKAPEVVPGIYGEVSFTLSYGFEEAMAARFGQPEGEGKTWHLSSMPVPPGRKASRQDRIIVEHVVETLGAKNPSYPSAYSTHWTWKEGKTLVEVFAEEDRQRIK